MIYDIEEFYTITEHPIDKFKYNMYVTMYYIILLVSSSFMGYLYLNDINSEFIPLTFILLITLIIRMAFGLTMLRTGGCSLKDVFLNMENFAPWFYFNKKEEEDNLEKEVIECYDFEEVKEEEAKKLFDSKIKVR